MRDNKSDLLLRECVCVCVSVQVSVRVFVRVCSRACLSSICIGLVFFVFVTYLSTVMTFPHKHICMGSSDVNALQRLQTAFGFILLLFQQQHFKNKDNLRALEFRDQLSVLSSFLLAY